MEDTDFDFLFEGLSPKEAKRMRKILAEWRIGDEHSFPVQLALLTRAQWRAAAQIPIVLKQSLVLLGSKVDEYRQQTSTLVKGFNAAANAKVAELQEIIADQKQASEAMLTDLRSETAMAKHLLNEMEQELKKGADELKRLRNQFVEEHRRLDAARERYEQQKTWFDWVVFGILLIVTVTIGIFIGWKLH